MSIKISTVIVFGFARRSINCKNCVFKRVKKKQICLKVKSLVKKKSYHIL